MGAWSTPRYAALPLHAVSNFRMQRTEDTHDSQNENNDGMRSNVLRNERTAICGKSVLSDGCGAQHERGAGSTAVPAQAIGQYRQPNHRAFFAPPAVSGPYVSFSKRSR